MMPLQWYGLWCNEPDLGYIRPSKLILGRRRVGYGIILLNVSRSIAA